MGRSEFWPDKCMYRLRIITPISAPPARCFDLARNIDVHLKSAKQTGERVVAGRKSGLLQLGDEITWEGRHFGVTQRLSVRITAFEPSRFFQDRMVKGAFRFFEHDHLFDATENGGTIMTDVLSFSAPLGPLGWLAERILLAPHLRRFLRQRGAFLKQLAEQGGDEPFAQ